ncbi:hypothetical protein [Mycolicibacterium goodii]|uniref:hypothetical protein n=1 Tax=Mycolicibacterium goodii TaxID=134601 RepID=UPI001BDC0E59|nr:hypothetical protein [Mycolicibacterium goodii]MBU8833596.1 hypothetical protein [Mycolicibacterium goodii]
MADRGIHLDVVTEVDYRSVRDAAADVQREFQRAGAASSDAWAKGFEKNADRMEKAARKAADASGAVIVADRKVAEIRAQVEQQTKAVESAEKRFNAAKKDGGATSREAVAAERELIQARSRLERLTTQNVTATERLNRAMRDEHSAVRSVANLQRELSNLTSSATESTSALTKMGNTAASLSRVAAPVAIVSLASAAWQLTGAAAAASQAVALLPAAAGAAGAGLGTLKIATLGFGDAMESIRDPEKFAEALIKLSPNARDAALSIQALLPAFDQLKNATQDALFANVGEQITAVTHEYLPAVQQMTTGIAGAFNDAFSGVAAQLMTPETQAALQGFTSNVTTAFHNLAPAVAPLTQALGDLMDVGSSFLPDIASAATEAAHAFADFIAEARQSGELQEFIGSGITALGTLVDIVESVVQAFYSFRDSGQIFLTEIAGWVDLVSATVRALNGEVVSLSEVVPSLGDVFEGMARRVYSALYSLFPPLKMAIDFYNALPGEDIPLPSEAFQGPGPAQPRGVGGPFIPGFGSGGATGGLGISASSGIGDVPTVFGGPGVTGPVGLGNIATTGIGTDPDRLGFYDPEKFKPGGGSAGGPKLPDAPVLPIEGSVPANPFGLPVDSSTFNAESSYLDAQHTLAEKRARLAQLENSAEATEQDRLKARNDVVEAERALQASEMRLNDARQSQYEQLIKSNDQYAKQLENGAAQLGEIGAKLSEDFGLSDGLAGLAENITKFLANLAAAPLLGQLEAIKQANPSQGGHGLLGVAAAQGAFGPQYTGYANTGRGSYPSAAATGVPMTSLPSAPSAAPGQSARDFAHSVMMPFWQSMGLEVGDHAADAFGEHQNGALDIMVPNKAIGQQVLQQVLSDPNVYGAIFDRHSYGYGHGPTGQLMPDRGSPTQNHEDHVHALYKPGNPGNINPTGTPIAAPSTVAVAPSAAAFPASSFGGVVPVSVTNWPAQGVSVGVPVPAAAGAGGTQSAVPGSPASGTGAGPLPGPPPVSSGAWAPTPAPLLSMAGGPVGGGAPQAAPFAANSVVAGQSPAGPPGAQGGGFSGAAGGLTGAALSAGAAGLDMLAPGAGQAAQTGIQLANRTIGYLGQLAGIGVSGILETFGVSGGNPLADPLKSLPGRVLAGIAGARPALPNAAGQGQQQAQQQAGQGGPGQPAPGQSGGPLVHIDQVNQAPNQTPDSVANSVANQFKSAEISQGFRGR